jgi:alpha-1,3-rhamnosyl/mannosyltransferase
VRVALFAHRLADANPTGIGRYVRELSTAIGAQAGAGDEYILTSTPEGAEPAPSPPGMTGARTPWPRRPVQLGWCLGLGPKLERAVGRLDALHLLHAFPPVPSRAPLVVTIPDLMPLQHPDWYTASERWTYRRSVRLALARAARIVTYSEFVATQVVALGADPARVHAVPLGVSATFASPVGSATARVACQRFGVEPGRFAAYVGAVSTRKNLLPVVRAVRALGPAALPLLVIGGDGLGAAAVDAEIAAHDMPGSVRRIGYVDDPTLAALVGSASVLVHPALTEGFGLTPLEAMAVGVPVVTSRSGSLPEVVGDAGLLVDDPGEVDAWVAALGRVFADHELRATLAEAGRRRASAFSWARTAAATIEVHRLAATA